MKNINLEQRISLLEKDVKEIKNRLSDTNIKQISGQLTPAKKLSIKEFLMSKKLDDDVKRTLTVAYFIENVENIKPFNIDDLKKAFRLAKTQLPSNINDKINMNIRIGRIMEAEEKKDAKKAWVLTATGEEYVKNKLNKN